MSNKGLYSTAGTQDNDFNLFPPQIIHKSNLDELINKEALKRYPLNHVVDDPFGETGEAESDPYGYDETARRAFIEGAKLFSHHLEQAELQARIDEHNKFAFAVTHDLDLVEWSLHRQDELQSTLKGGK